MEESLFYIILYLTLISFYFNYLLLFFIISERKKWVVLKGVLLLFNFINSLVLKNKNKY